MEVSARSCFPELAQPFRVAFGTITGKEVVTVEIRDGDHGSLGSAVP